jgi:uncharacterized protein (TIGR00251 family)
LIEKALRKNGSTTTIDLIVTTGSKKNEITGFDKWRERINVRIKEKPMDGKANDAIIHLFSNIFGVKSHNVKIISGLKTHQKTVEIDDDYNKVKKTLCEILGKD